METVTIVGCGDIGCRTARRFIENGTKVRGMTRSPERARILSRIGIEPIQADLDQPSSLTGLVLKDQVVFYFAPPPSTGEEDPRMAAFVAAVGTALPKCVVYISTSAVYGDCGGDWIDETQSLQPGTARGRRRLAAEQALLAWGMQTGVRVVILRVPGIYAPDRLPEARLCKGLPVLREQDSPYTNRIHAEDLADICVAATANGKSGAAYNVSDGNPSTMCDYFNRVADHLQLPRPPQLDLERAREVLSEGMMSFMSESKRLDNRRMLNELGVVLRYPELSDGLKSEE